MKGMEVLKKGEKRKNAIAFSSVGRGGNSGDRAVAHSEVSESCANCPAKGGRVESGTAITRSKGA